MFRFLQLHFPRPITSGRAIGRAVLVVAAKCIRSGEKAR